MRWLMKLMIIGAFGWSGYWVIGAKAQENIFANWLQSSKEQGWVAETGEMRVTGFPNRFDTVISQLNILGPKGDWGWQADGFEIYALSYQPNHIIMSWPGEQVISNKHGSVTVQGTQMRGSIEVAANTNLTLERLRIEATELDVKSSEGWQTGSKTTNISLYQDQDQASRYRFGAYFEDVTIPRDFMPGVVQLGQNTDLISSVRADAYIDFDQEIDRGALNTGLPLWNLIDIESIELNWGRALLVVSGQLTPADNGYVEGEIAFHVKNWQILFNTFKQIAHMPPQQMALVENALNGMAVGNDLEFSLSFSDGRAYLGPFPIGRAPENPHF